MVNDLMVCFMEKKQYIIPLVETEIWNMKDLMKASGTSPELPPGMGEAAPRRRSTEVF